MLLDRFDLYQTSPPDRRRRRNHHVTPRVRPLDRWAGPFRPVRRFAAQSAEKWCSRRAAATSYLLYYIVLALMQNRPTSRAQPCLCCTGHGLTPSRRSAWHGQSLPMCISPYYTTMGTLCLLVEAMWGLDGYSTGETLPIYLVPKGKDSAKTRRECPC